MNIQSISKIYNQRNAVFPSNLLHKKTWSSIIKKKKKHIILTLQPALVFTSRQMNSVQKRVLVMTLDGVISYFGTSSFTIHQKIRQL